MAASLLEGHASAGGTARYAARFGDHLAPEHFRTGQDGLRIASIGIGTYLGVEDDATDGLYRSAVTRALERGLNVVDAAINYRHQRSERTVGTALTDLVGRGAVGRDEVLIATKGGFIPFDGDLPRERDAYVLATYVKSGIVRPEDLVERFHCMSPRYLMDQIERSRANLGLATIDVYYLHNPESQLGAIDRPEFRRRIRDAFVALEEAVRQGKIRRYGTATWHGYRLERGARDYLSLEEIVAAARDAGGADHHFAVIQLPYNLAMTEALTRPNQRVNGEVVSTLEAARRLGLYVIASASVYQGQLTRKLPPMISERLPQLDTDAQRALQFVRSTPGIRTALVGMKSVGHVEENAGVARTPPLSPEQFHRRFTEPS